MKKILSVTIIMILILTGCSQIENMRDLIIRDDVYGEWEAANVYNRSSVDEAVNLKYTLIIKTDNTFSMEMDLEKNGKMKFQGIVEIKNPENQKKCKLIVKKSYSEYPGGNEGKSEDVNEDEFYYEYALKDKDTLIEERNPFSDYYYKSFFSYFGSAKKVEFKRKK